MRRLARERLASGVILPHASLAVRFLLAGRGRGERSLLIASLGLMAAGSLLLHAADQQSPDAHRAADCSTQPARELADSLKRLKIVPWLEVNRGTRDEVENAVEGLLIWKDVTDTAIVTTRIGRARMYVELKRRVPDMTIIPGLKTAGYVGYSRRFDDLQGWGKIAAEVERLAHVTGEKRVVLENETALEGKAGDPSKPCFWTGAAEVDFDRLKRGLRMLPAHVQVWWYPGFAVSAKSPQLDDTWYGRAENLGWAVEATCDVRFVVMSHAQPPERNLWWTERAQKICDRVASKPTLPIVYFGPERGYWPFERLEELLAGIDTPEVVVYPSAHAWVAQARAFQQVREQVSEETRQ